MLTLRQFDHEKLEVYQTALQFVGWTHSLIEELKSKSVPLIRETCDQLDRASLSIVLNIAEGNGRRSTKQRARFSMTLEAPRPNVPPALMCW